MNARTERLTFTGAAGAIEALRDAPPAHAAPRGSAIIAHPHPLYGGDMHHKVVQTLARAFAQCGYTALRFNFRGVGASAGAHDGGRGECADLLAVVQQAAATGPLALAGFSFGSYVASHALAQLWPQGRIAHVVFVGTAAGRWDVAPIPADAHDKTLVLHGEDDDTVPLADVLQWAGAQALPVTVVPGGGHFFHGQLPLLKSLVVRHLRSGF